MHGMAHFRYYEKIIQNIALPSVQFQLLVNER